MQQAQLSAWSPPPTPCHPEPLPAAPVLEAAVLLALQGVVGQQGDHHQHSPRGPCPGEGGHAQRESEGPACLCREGPLIHPRACGPLLVVFLHHRFPEETEARHSDLLRVADTQMEELSSKQGIWSQGGFSREASPVRTGRAMPQAERPALLRGVPAPCPCAGVRRTARSCACACQASWYP
ncbi:hypothetical protein HJG60_009133 [Phyllostomus discolor]|uniref:Uncharacterized protein n=1 Tax=Phyllostomus discolor TaxID=89673 RepID=A0A833YRY7_9CHIR|nr:hypothetical protein HJG60_009133 [Phyllostomus discolor]